MLVVQVVEYLMMGLVLQLQVEQEILLPQLLLKEMQVEDTQILVVLILVQVVVVLQQLVKMEVLL
jgi:hypothetical protein|tara:strand:+ start:242 stop:436 length:195 start_codon:yes stop_codon:yes gene_type:complete